MDENIEISFGGILHKFPIIHGTEGEKAIDISSLRKQTGLITIDTGFKNTGSTKSSITFLNGEKGILRHRGYSIDDLTNKSTFLEVAYLLIYGELPNLSKLKMFRDNITPVSYTHLTLPTKA